MTAVTSGSHSRRALSPLLLARSRVAWLVSGVTLLSLIPRLLTIGRFWTVDEQNWMRRSQHFSDALASGNFADASAARASGNTGSISTMPGVTTMWIGTAARALWGWGREAGRWSDDTDVFRHSDAGLTTAQLLMAVLVSVLTGLLVFLLARWVGLGAAGVTGVLLSTEPFLVALGSILHTDALVATFGSSALVATALALGLPHATSWQGQRWAAALAGALWSGSLLTKLSALPLLLSVIGMGGWALARALRRGLVRSRGAQESDEPADDGTRGLSVSAITRLAGWWAGAAVVVFVLAYPAFWTDPMGEVRTLWDGVGLVSQGGRPTLFLGDQVETPGPLFLVVALPLRVTPWFLVGGVVAAFGLWFRRVTRGFALALLVMAGPSFVVISLASKQASRYGMLVLIVGAIAVGAAGAHAAQALREQWPELRRPMIGVAWGLAILMIANAVTVAPWGLVYFNPVLGGSATAERAIPMGIGEGLERAGAVIRERAGDRCDEILIWSYPVKPAFPCGEVTYTRRSDTDFVVVYVDTRQRRSAEYLEELVQSRQLIDVITIRGITYVEIYGAVGSVG